MQPVKKTQKLIRYELVNPSDCYTFEASCHASASAAVFLLGEGMYAATSEDGDKELEVPIFIFGGATEWFQETFGQDFSSYLDENELAIADVLETLIIGKFEDRAAYHEGLELIDDPIKKQQWKDKWLDKRRSSMNNIGARAEAYIKAIRGKHDR